MHLCFCADCGHCSLLAVFQSVDTDFCIISVSFQMLLSFAVDVSGPLSFIIVIPLRLLIQTILNNCRSSLQMDFHFLPDLHCLAADYSIADDRLTGILCHANSFNSCLHVNVVKAFFSRILLSEDFTARFCHGSELLHTT